jgi:hypothetical protein
MVDCLIRESGYRLDTGDGERNTWKNYPSDFALYDELYCVSPLCVVRLTTVSVWNNMDD